MQKLKSLLEGIYSAQNVFYEALLWKGGTCPFGALNNPQKGITKGPPQMRGSLSIATWWRVSPPADL